jgi:hypothetical protein
MSSVHVLILAILVRAGACASIVANYPIGKPCLDTGRKLATLTGQLAWNRSHHPCRARAVEL